MNFEKAMKICILENKEIMLEGYSNHIIMYKDDGLWCKNCDKRFAINKNRFKGNWKIVEKKKTLSDEVTDDDTQFAHYAEEDVKEALKEFTDCVELVLKASGIKSSTKEKAKEIFGERLI